MISQMMKSFVLIILIRAAIITESKYSDTHADKIDQVLKKLNKSALKSIKSPDGDIIDCVHMKNHPIYDHPLFRNHTIQMKPSSNPKGWSNETSYTEKENIVTQLWTINGKCPKNSIAIRRTKKEDVLRARSIKRFGKKDSNNLFQPNLANFTKNDDMREYVILLVYGNFHGAQATINIWKPYVQMPNEYSLAQMWILGGPTHEMNSIQFGWQVNPEMYGDDNVRSFIYWTNDGYKTGCHNLDCGGFVQISHEFALGAIINSVSTLGGQQFHIPVTIWKDPESGNWWLKLNHHILVGYWPSTIFNHLENGADSIHWGGEIKNNRDGLQHTTTKMGSGHFAEEDYQKASYFKNLGTSNEHGIWEVLQGGDPYITNKNCYNIRIGNAMPPWYRYFYYGGPGRNPNCK